MIDEPVRTLSLNSIKLKASELKIIKSSANLDKCIAQVAAADKKSIAKSLSDTESIELLVGFLKPSFFAVNFLSILNDVPAKAADPKGHSSIRSILFKNLFLSLLNIST